MERRLFFYHHVRHSPYPKGSDKYHALLKVAREYLSQDYIDRHVDAVDQAIEQVRDHERFSKDLIANMPISQVDRYLAVNGIVLEDQTPDVRRECLFEYYHLPKAELPDKVLPRKQKSYNKYNLRDVILMYPSMTWAEFQERFGNIMPTCTTNSFYGARRELRKKGFPIPKLKPGPKGFDPATIPILTEDEFVDIAQDKLGMSRTDILKRIEEVKNNE